MNCPLPHPNLRQPAAQLPDLPVRYRDTTMVYRDEQSGELGGLAAASRGITDDAHVFCRTSLGRIRGRQPLERDIETFYKGCGFLRTLLVRLSMHDRRHESLRRRFEQVESTVGQLRSIIESKVGQRLPNRG